MSLARVVGSFVQGSPTECGVSDRDRGTSRMGRLDPLELSSLRAGGGGGGLFCQQKNRFSYT